MAFQVKNTGRDAFMDGLNNWMGNGCSLEVWTSGYGTKLCTWTMGGSTKVYAASSGGVLTMNAPSAATVAAVATGTMGVMQIKDSGGNVVMKDFTVGTSGADFIVDNVSVNSGQNVTLQYASSTLTAPNAGF